jgi:hypothetical protein
MKVVMAGPTEIRVGFCYPMDTWRARLSGDLLTLPVIHLRHRAAMYRFSPEISGIRMPPLI